MEVLKLTWGFLASHNHSGVLVSLFNMYRHINPVILTQMLLEQVTVERLSLFPRINVFLAGLNAQWKTKFIVWKVCVGGRTRSRSFVCDSCLCNTCCDVYPSCSRDCFFFCKSICQNSISVQGKSSGHLYRVDIVWEMSCNAGGGGNKIQDLISYLGAAWLFSDN